MGLEREFFVYAVKVNEITGWPVILLQDGEKKKTLSISTHKASAFPTFIALQPGKHLKHPRPLTHDLFLELVLFAGLKILKIIIDNTSPEGSFIAKIIVIKESKENLITLNASASDAIAIALRAKSPILVSSKLVTRLKSFSPDDPPYRDITAQYFFTP